MSVAMNTAVAADSALVAELTGLVPNPPLVTSGAVLSASSDGAGAVADIALPLGDPGLADLRAVLVAQGAEATVTVRRTVVAGGISTSFAAGFASAVGAHASQRRIVNAVLAFRA